MLSNRNLVVPGTHKTIKFQLCKSVHPCLSLERGVGLCVPLWTEIAQQTLGCSTAVAEISGL